MSGGNRDFHLTGRGMMLSGFCYLLEKLNWLREFKEIVKFIFKNKYTT